ncbi:SPFH domain / Band 7 family protein [Phycisphaerae bacterium RAS1]|nr:SPFH domain / Band 7 family protein [Phycisphaerae bacterium RAS1]
MSINSTPRPQRPLTAPRPVDQAQESLVSALKASFNVLRLILLLLLIAYVGSGVFRVQPGEQGLIVRFGELLTNTDARSPHHGTPLFDPGWQWALPDPLDEKIRLSGKLQQVQIDTFLFKRNPDDLTKSLRDISTLTQQLKPGVDGAMLTGDKNLAHGLWTVEYHVVDGARFVQNVGETPEAVAPLIRNLAETSVLQEVASRRFVDVTRGELAAVSAAVQSRLQKELDKLDAGVTVDKVSAETIAPIPVRDAYTRLSLEENNKKREEDLARQQAAEILNKAAGPQHVQLLEKIRAYGAMQTTGSADLARQEGLRTEIETMLESAGGQVAERLRAARAEANEERTRVQREYEEFVNFRDQWRESGNITTLGLWNAMLRNVLGSPLNELFYIPASGPVDIVINRDPERQLDIQKTSISRPPGS